MHCNAFFGKHLDRHVISVCIVLLALSCLCLTWSSSVIAQDTAGEESVTGNEKPADINTALAIKRIRYNGRLLLIHLPTNTARALVMPEPVLLQEDTGRLPGVKLAYEDNVIGFFATRDFTRRIVTFIGTNSGNEYNMQIRASKNGIAEPLEIVK